MQKKTEVSKAQPKKKAQIRGKGLKKKKVSLKFTIDCTHPVEDSIMVLDDFVSTFFYSQNCALIFSIFFRKLILKLE